MNNNVLRKIVIKLKTTKAIHEVFAYRSPESTIVISRSHLFKPWKEENENNFLWGSNCNIIFLIRCC